MADLLFVVVLIAFFGLAYALVKACERIVGRDEVASIETHASEDQIAA